MDYLVAKELENTFEEYITLLFPNATFDVNISQMFIVFLI